MSDTRLAGTIGAGLGKVNKPLFAITGGFILLFCAYALIDLEGLSALVDTGFGWSARYFGLYWQILLLGTFLIGLRLAGRPCRSGKPCLARVLELPMGFDDHVHLACGRGRVLGRRRADCPLSVDPAAVR